MPQPESIEFKVTPAVRRPMVATNDQKVFRAYGPNGSVWRCERGVSRRVLWWLLAHKVIEDEPLTTAKELSLTITRMRLSKVGFDILKTGKVR